MKIWYSTYQLYPKGSLSSQHKAKFRHGAILRVRFESGEVGHADICPFGEMGDKPLEYELRQLAIGKSSNLGLRSLYFAELDAKARAEKRSLYSPHVRIKNHFLITDIHKFDLQRIEQIEASGYTEFKIKMGQDLVKETEVLTKLVGRISSRTKLRLDFNAILNRDRFVDWFDKNQKWLRPCLDFIEDPFVYDAREWREVSQKRGITFALDLAADAISSQAEGAQVIVIKPAVCDPEPIIQKYKTSNKKFIFTHYMDFPIGQMFALVTVQQLYPRIHEQLLTCGLQFHDIYEGFSFQDQVRMDGPYILPPEGYGIGFDSLLANMKWDELK
jgi:O-succinylbenzoate synthase